MRTLLFIAASLFITSNSLAQELFKSEPAKKASKEYQKRLEEAEKQYIADLESALAEAAKKVDIDEILAIKNTLNVLKKVDQFDAKATKGVAMKTKWGAANDPWITEFLRDGTLITIHGPTGGAHQTGGWKVQKDGTIHAWWNRNRGGEMPLNEMKITAQKDGQTLTVIGCDHKGGKKTFWQSQWKPKK